METHTLTRRQRREMIEAQRAQFIENYKANADIFTGYICKNCGRPSPAGIGYAAEVGPVCVTEANENCGPHA